MSKIEIGNLGLIQLPTFKSREEAMRQGIDDALQAVKEGRVMYSSHGGPMHPLSGTMKRLEYFGVEIFCIGFCEIWHYEDSWESCFNMIMRDQKISLLKNTSLEKMVYEFVYKSNEDKIGKMYFYAYIIELLEVGHLKKEDEIVKEAQQFDFIRLE